MVLRGLQDVVSHSGSFLDRVDTGLQIGDQNLALRIGGTVQVVAAVLNLGDAERYTRQRGTVGTGLDQTQRGLDGVGKDKLGFLIGVKLNDALGAVDHVTVAGLLHHHIGPGRQLGQVNLAVLVSGKLLRSIVPRH